MMRALAWIGLVLAFVSLAALVLADDGMTACQKVHSFGVCHDTIH